ncbi:MAG: hypothetical protein ACT4PT_10860 [Methanobacteriota archaeon]
MRFAEAFGILSVLSLLLSPAAWAEADEEEERDRDDDAEGRGDEGREDDDDKDFDDVKRNVESEVSATAAEFKLEREDAAAEDELKFSLEVEDGVEAKVEFESENETGESEVEFEVEFLELVEFEDGDGDGAFDEGEEAVQSIDLDADVAWRPFALEDASVGGKSAKVLRAEADLPDGGVFGLRFYVVGDFVTLNATRLAPTEVKFDILIQAFPFGSNSSRLALLVETEHEAKFESEPGDEAEGEIGEDEDGLVVVADGVKFRFAWKETATVDGASAPVRVTISKAETETETDGDESKTEEKRELALAYPRGADILHDPVLGVGSVEPAGGRVPGPGTALALGAVVLAVALAVGRRRH